MLHRLCECVFRHASVFSEGLFTESVFSESAFSERVFSESVFSESVFFHSVFSLSIFFQSVVFQNVFLRNVPNLHVFKALQVNFFGNARILKGPVSKTIHFFSHHNFDILIGMMNSLIFRESKLRYIEV